MAISYAPAGSGPNAGGIGWFNFGSVTFNPGAPAVNVTGTLNDGTVVSFDINVTNDSGVAAGYQALQPPSWAGTFFANPAFPGGYNGVVGEIDLICPIFGIGQNTAHLSNITLTDSIGNPVTNYTTIVADAESTDFSEVMTWVTNGTAWTQFALLGNTIPPTITGLGTNTVQMTGTAAPGVIHENYVLTTNSPTAIDVSTQATVTTSRLGFAIGFAVTKVQIQKNVQGRLDPTDQFTLNVTGTYPSTATTTGNANGIQTQTAISFGLPGAAFTVNESMAPGSLNPLSAYTQTVTAVNLSPGQTIPPVGPLPQTVTPTLGDVIIYTVTNAILPPTAVKTVDKAFADFGDVLTYSVAINNPNNGILNGVGFTDAIPSGTTFVGGSLTVTNATVVGTNPAAGLTLNNIPANTTATVSWQVTVGNAIPTPNPIPNTATVTDPSGTTITTNQVTTTVNHADLTAPGSFVKTVDLAFAEPGDVLTYTMSLTNTGNVAADNVVLTDAVPAGTTFVAGSVIGATGTPPTLTLNSSIPAGGTAVVSFQVQVGNTVPSPNPIPNSAAVNYDYTVDPAVPDGASGTAQSNSVSTQINTAALTTVKSVDKLYAQPGDTLTYSLTLQNTGNVSADNIVVTDIIPAGTTFVAGSLVGATGAPPTLTLNNPIAGGASAIVTFQVTVDDGVPVPNPMPNTATAAFTYTINPADPDGAAGSSTSNTVNTTVSFADVTTTKTVEPTFAQPGDTLTYTLTLQNNGNSAANNVVITDPVPTGTTYVPNSLTGATGTLPNLTLLAPIPAGGSAVIPYQLKIGNAVPNPNPLLNTASAAYTYTINPANPNGASAVSVSDTASAQVNTAKLNLVKSADKTLAYIGDTITYQIAVTNSGNVPADNVVITDLLPVGTAYVPGSLSVNVPASGNPTTGITLTNPVAPGQTVAISFQINVTAIPNPNPIVNTANAAYAYTVDPAEPDGVSATAASNAVTTIVFRYNFSQQISDLIESVALEQAALAAIANAEGAKIQRMVAMGNVTAQELLCVNKSVSDMLESLSLLENILKQKMNTVNCQINGTGAGC